MAEVSSYPLEVDLLSQTFDTYNLDSIDNFNIDTKEHKKDPYNNLPHVHQPVRLLNRHKLSQTKNTKHRSSRTNRSPNTPFINLKDIRPKKKTKRTEIMSRPSTPIITLDYTNVVVQEVPDEDTVNYVSSAFVGNAPVEYGECIVLNAGEELLYKNELQNYIASHQDHPIFTMVECEPEDEEEEEEEEEEDEEDFDEDDEEEEEDEDEYDGYTGQKNGRNRSFALYYVEEPATIPKDLYSSAYDFGENSTKEFDALGDDSDGSVYTYTFSSYQVEELDDEVEDVDMF
ncbi:hypothetical protein ACO0QE_001342 [Hanseniaspora vineae]